MSGNVSGPPAPVLIFGDIPDRLLTQTTDSFQVLQQSDGARADSRVIRYDISLVMLLSRHFGLVVTITKPRFPPSA